VRWDKIVCRTRGMDPIIPVVASTKPQMAKMNKDTAKASALAKSKRNQSPIQKPCETQHGAAGGSAPRQNH